MNDKTLVGYRKAGVALTFVYMASQAGAWKYAAAVAGLYLVVNLIETWITKKELDT